VEDLIAGLAFDHLGALGFMHVELRAGDMSTNSLGET
jgi:hypothetical protein